MGVPNSSALAATHTYSPAPCNQNNEAATANGSAGPTATTNATTSLQAPSSISSNLAQTTTGVHSSSSAPMSQPVEQCSVKNSSGSASSGILNSVFGAASKSSGASPMAKDSKQVAGESTDQIDSFSCKLAAAGAAEQANNSRHSNATSLSSASNSTTTNNKPHTLLAIADEESSTNVSTAQLQPTSDAPTIINNHNSNQPANKTNQMQTSASDNNNSSNSNGNNIDASISSCSSGVGVSNTSANSANGHLNAPASVEPSSESIDENQVYASAVPDLNGSLSNNKEPTTETQSLCNKNNNSVKTETNPQQYNFYSHHNKTQHQHHHNHHHNQHQHHHNHHQNQQYHSNHHSAESLSKTNLYIRGLSADTSDDDLFSLCSRYGSIVSTKAILDKNTNKCKGYGFVDFETPAAAETAVAELQKQGVLVHMAKQQEADPTNLYIANLPQMMTEYELENLLRPYGQVVSTRILMDQNRQPRGVGFARMETKEQCDLIIASLNGQIVKGSKEPLSVKFADGANKKRVHHFQHKHIGGNVFMNEHLWRSSSNDLNYPLMNNNAGSRNFHVGSFDHSRQNHALSHHNNGLVKHQQMLTSVSGYHPHHQGAGQHSAAHHNHQQHHQSQLQQQHHHVHNHSPHSSHRSQNQGPYTGGSNFPISGSMGANDASQWLHPPQPGQPYVLQPSMMTPAQGIDPSLHYVNLANQMQGLQIANPAVSGYLSPQQWPVWPSGVGGNKHSSTPQQSGNHGGDHQGYNDTD